MMIILKKIKLVKKNNLSFLETKSCGLNLSFEILPSFVLECLKVENFFTDTFLIYNNYTVKNKL